MISFGTFFEEHLHSEILKIMMNRAGRAWKHHLADTQKDAQGDLDSEEAILEEFKDWLNSEIGITINDRGLIEFWELNEATKRLIGDFAVELFHYTSSSLVRSIKQHGLKTGLKRTDLDSSGVGVYLTTEGGGTVVDGYTSRAVAEHGGHGIRVCVKAYLSELRSDPDDADISSGRTQFVVNKVDPSRIVEIGNL